MTKNKTIIVKGSEITIIQVHETDYISLTDMVKNFGDETIIYNWLRNRNTVEFLGIWERIYNTYFKPIEFDRFKISINSVFIHQGLPQNERLEQLNNIAITQMKSLLGNKQMKKL